jgi:hypothetical protein
MKRRIVQCSLRDKTREAKELDRARYSNININRHAQLDRLGQRPPSFGLRQRTSASPPSGKLHLCYL